MYIRHPLLALIGTAALTFTVACSDQRRGKAERESPTATAERTDTDNWARERDEYVAQRQRELADVDRRWENFKSKASAKSRTAWNEVREESAGLRRELNELRNSSKESWSEAKRRIDAGWEKFEAKVRDAFTNDQNQTP
jgi:hypothetical protein